MIGKIKNLSANVRRALQGPMYGFIRGHNYLSPKRLEAIAGLVKERDPALVREFETSFAALLGHDHAVAFAAARMGFYALLRARSVGAGDEVILLGSTCAVMANAVLRTGATPVYADVDPETFGSSAPAIEKRINSRTRMIVAQHSFGIPCDITPIVALARSRSIFVVEDCAITLGSRRNGVIAGNFADAALISTDHSKPINTMIGGLVLTKDAALARKLRDLEAQADRLPEPQQRALWGRLLFERDNSPPQRYASIALRDQIARYVPPSGTQPFLAADSGARAGRGYPYPAKLPVFLAAVGLEELARWGEVANERKKLLARLLNCIRGTWIEPHLPAAYRDSRLDVVPLRFVWSEPDGPAIREQLSGFIDVDWTWFLQPLIATAAPLAKLGYASGSCPVSERLGLGMINLPCSVALEDTDALVELFSTVLRERRVANRTVA